MPKGPLEKANVKANIDIVSKGVALKSSQEDVGPVLTSGPTANVGFSASYTKNLGNYESVKITVSLHYPVEVNANTWWPVALDTAMDHVQNWVDDRMSKAVAEIEAD